MAHLYIGRKRSIRSNFSGDFAFRAEIVLPEISGDLAQHSCRMVWPVAEAAAARIPISVFIPNPVGRSCSGG